MNSKNLLPLIAVVASGLPLVANAGAGAFYVGAGVGSAEYESSEFVDCLSTCDPFSDNDFAYNVFAGYSVTDAVALELGWQDWGELTDDAFGTTVQADPEAFTVMAVGTVPVGGDFSVFGKAGVAFLSVDVTDKLNGNNSSDTDSQELALGGGLQWNIGNFGVRAETLWIDAEDADKALMYGISGLFSFGGHAKAAPAAAAVVAAPVVAKAVAPPPPKDSDGDGVVDGTDQCPDTPKGDRVGSQGCSCDVSREVTFKTNSAELTAEGKAVLDEMAETLTRLRWVTGTIEGHTDSTGPEAYNQKLSERRAKTVADYLQAKGVGAGRMNVVGMGESQPIGDNKTAEGRAQNRRVVAKRTDCAK